MPGACNSKLKNHDFFIQMKKIEVECGLICFSNLLKGIRESMLAGRIHDIIPFIGEINRELLNDLNIVYRLYKQQVSVRIIPNPQYKRNTKHTFPLIHLLAVHRILKEQQIG